MNKLEPVHVVIIAFIVCGALATIFAPPENIRPVVEVRLSTTQPSGDPDSP